VPSKLTDDELGELRGAFAAGATPSELALAYDVTERHVWRVCRGIERRLPRVEGSVASAVERFLAGLELDERTDGVIAETTKLVAAAWIVRMGGRPRVWRRVWSSFASRWRCGTGSLTHLMSLLRGVRRGFLAARLERRRGAL